MRNAAVVLRPAAAAQAPRPVAGVGALRGVVVGALEGEAAELPGAGGVAVVVAVARA